jgi:uncharacterized protein YndB with AHSA1/START domain
MAVFEIYIKTTPERLWQAITDPEMRAKYNFGVEVHSDWAPGSRYLASVHGTGIEITEGQNLEVDPPHRLVQTFRALWSEDVKATGFSRVTWEITPVGDSCRLVVVHDRLPADAGALRRLADGPFRSKDAARDGPVAYHPRLAASRVTGVLKAKRVLKPKLSKQEH